MASTPNLALPYPAPGDAPDGPGALYLLATAMDSSIVSLAASAFMDLASGISYDSSNGLNNVITFGHLHVVNVCLVASAPIASGTTMATMRAGHRPSATVYTGATVIDNGAGVSGSAYLSATGTLGVSSFVPDQLSDGKFSALRCTFVYSA